MKETRLIAETRALAAAYRRIIEEGSGEVLAVSGPTATFAFVEELVADTYLARWDAFPREGLSFYAFNAAKTTLGRWLVTVYAETNRYPWAAAGQGQPTAADIKAMAVELVEHSGGGAGGGEGEESGREPSSGSSVAGEAVVGGSEDASTSRAASRWPRPRGLARVTRQLLLSGDDPAARLRALMPLELGIFGLGDLAQPVLVRDFLNTLTLMSGHAYPAAVLRHHAYYLLRAASFSRRSFGLGHLEAALDVLASATATSLSYSRLAIRVRPPPASTRAATPRP